MAPFERWPPYDPSSPYVDPPWNVFRKLESVCISLSFLLVVKIVPIVYYYCMCCQFRILKSLHGGHNLEIEVGNRIQPLSIISTFGLMQQTFTCSDHFQHGNDQVEQGRLILIFVTCNASKTSKFSSIVFSH